ncbi:unnamed protein product [Phytomonas sp. EM1]|nr:unnamed protein product [Phytomonas sp. EM1]|eukprot:CCW65253.1 unnamed protein product [Phytomonas sp. isolate EM1]
MLSFAPRTDLHMERVATLEGHKGRVWCVAWCPTANILASSSADTTVRLWSQASESARDASPTKWNCIAILEGEHDRTVRHVSWSPSGEYLACASFDHTVSIWRRSSMGSCEFEVEGVLDGHESEVKCVEWATDNILATCSRDHTVWVWERIADGEYECCGILTGHTQDVKHCLWYLSPNSNQHPLVLSCGYDDTIRVWCDSHRQDDWHCIQTLKEHEGTVWMMAFQRLEYCIVNEEGRESGECGNEACNACTPQPLLCACSDDRTVSFWKRNASGKFENVARGSGFAERPIYSVSWAPHGEPLVACGSGDNSVTLLILFQDSAGLHAQIATKVVAAHEADVNSVSFSSFGKLYADNDDGVGDGLKSQGLLLATGGDDNVVNLWTVSAT